MTSVHEVSSFPQVRLKYLVNSLSGGTPDSRREEFWADGTIPWISISDMSNRHSVSKTAKQITPEARQTAGLEIGPAGTVLFAMYASVGEVAVTEVDAVWNQALIGLVPQSQRLSSSFLHYCLLAVRPYLPALYRSNTQNNLNAEQVNNLRVPLPSRAQQEAIVAFLDRETAEIDAFIDDQERLIELLEERRTATITHAVTKGLDPTVPMNDSGIEWVGSIPKHWTLNRFSRCVRINSGQVDPKHPEFSDLPLIAPNHVESGTGKLIELETAAAQGADSGKYFVRAGQVIYSKIRPNLMKTVIAPCDCLCSADMYGLQADSNLLGNKFLMYLLLSRPFHDYAVDQSMRVAMPKLNQDTLGAAPVWFPPLVEQEHIVNYLETELAVIDTTMKDAREAIALSRERRAALISAAVTGQLDVTQMSSRESTGEVLEDEVRV